MAEDAKPTKDKHQAAYQAAPRGSQRCGICSMFVKPSGCTLVKGNISPMGWCKYYERKRGE